MDILLLIGITRMRRLMVMNLIMGRSGRGVRRRQGLGNVMIRAGRGWL
jgi:hypothetical protein